MSNAIKKIADKNGIFQYVELCNLSQYSTTDWIHDPDVSALSAVSRNYWKVVGTSVVEMSQPEKDVVDATFVSLFADNDDENHSRIYSDTKVYAANETLIYHPPITLTDIVVHVIDPNVLGLTGQTFISPTGIGWDPSNVSTTENNINDGNVATYSYNNSVSGNTTGLILGIDLGSATMVNALKLWDYSTAYFNTEWEFIGTNDATGATYTVILSHAQASPNLDPSPLLLSFVDSTFRYFGVRCVTPKNASYSIIRELELYTGTVSTYAQELSPDGDQCDVSIMSDNSIEVTNRRAESATFKIIIVGK
jgi:hypothetical protein